MSQFIMLHVILSESEGSLQMQEQLFNGAQILRVCPYIDATGTARGSEVLVSSWAQPLRVYQSVDEVRVELDRAEAPFNPEVENKLRSLLGEVRDGILESVEGIPSREEFQALELRVDELAASGAAKVDVAAKKK